jgi:hypothetical protein
MGRPAELENCYMSHSIKSAASKGHGAGKAPGTIDATALDDGPRTAGAVPIPDPDVEGSGSKYAARGTFGLGAAVRAYTPVTLGKSKTFMRANLTLAAEVTLVDAAKSNSTGKDLYLLLPEALDLGATDGIATCYNALVVPIVDRDGQAFLWDIRRATRDGVQLGSYDSATDILPALVEKWGRVQWTGDGYSRDEPYNPAVLGDPKWPANLRTFDDWVEAAFRGKIIAAPDHKVLQHLRGEI